MKKLDDESVFEIKKFLKEGIPQKELALKFKVSQPTISRIKKGILHSRIVLYSEEYSKGFEDGYKKGFNDGIKMR